MREYTHTDISDNGEYFKNYGNNGCLFCTINSYLKTKNIPLLTWNNIKLNFDNLPKEGSMIDIHTHELFLCDIANYLEIQLIFYSSPISNILNEDVCQIIGKKHSSNNKINILKLTYNHYVLLKSSIDDLKEISQDIFNSRKKEYDNMLKIEAEETLKLIKLIQKTSEVKNIDKPDQKIKIKEIKLCEKKEIKLCEIKEIKLCEKKEIEIKEIKPREKKEIKPCEKKEIKLCEEKKTKLCEKTEQYNGSSFTKKLIEINNILDQLVLCISKNKI
jgi:hypothetical protein